MKIRVLFVDGQVKIKEVGSDREVPRVTSLELHFDHRGVSGTMTYHHADGFHNYVKLHRGEILLGSDPPVTGESHQDMLRRRENEYQIKIRAALGCPPTAFAAGGMIAQTGVQAGDAVKAGVQVRFNEPCKATFSDELDKAYELGAHCPECWGTGYWHGVGAPCSRECGKGKR